jgi:hypothetical protein
VLWMRNYPTELAVRSIYRARKVADELDDDAWRPDITGVTGASA